MAREELSMTKGTFLHHQRDWTARAVQSVTAGEAAHAYHMAAMYEGMAEQIARKINSLV